MACSVDRRLDLKVLHVAARSSTPRQPSGLVWCRLLLVLVCFELCRGGSILATHGAASAARPAWPSRQRQELARP